MQPIGLETNSAVSLGWTTPLTGTSPVLSTAKEGGVQRKPLLDAKSRGQGFMLLFARLDPVP